MQNHQAFHAEPNLNTGESMDYSMDTETQDILNKLALEQN